MSKRKQNIKDPMNLIGLEIHSDAVIYAKDIERYIRSRFPLSRVKVNYSRFIHRSLQNKY